MPKAPAVLDWLRRRPDEPLPPKKPIMVTVGQKRLPLVIRRLPQATRMTLRLAPDGSEVRLSIPRWGRTAEAVAFVRSRADWLAQQLEKLPVAAPLAPGGALPIRGTPHTIVHAPTLPRRPQLAQGQLHIGGPTDTLDKRLARWLEGEARTLFAADLADYCQRAGVPVPSLALSRAQRRWGSCSASGIIRLNWRLVMAPDPVRRSVVAHEVAHLVHFNHSADFHMLLAALFEGDISEANHWLKHHGRSLYAVLG